MHRAFVLNDGDVEGDVAVVEMELEGAENLTLYLLYLLLDQFVFHKELYSREGADVRQQVLHTGGYAAEILRHAIAHGEPLEL